MATAAEGIASLKTAARESARSGPGIDPRSTRHPLIRGLAVLVVALAPALAAIWAVPWFVTQDAPAHVYNAEILTRSFDPASPFGAFFAIRWQPIPNWVGHVVLAALVRVLPAWAADRIMTSVTLAGFAAAVFWLRVRVAGPYRGECAGAHHLTAAALLSTLLAMNITWLLGFTSFTLGACLFPITLGYWWPRRDRLDARGILGMWALLILGYFCHLVSLGLTAMALGVLALASPLPPPASPDAGGRIPWQRLRARLVPLAAAFLPMIPLGLMYLGLAHRGGPMHPVWGNLTDPLAPSGWTKQAAWADPITLMRKDALTFTGRLNPGFIVLAPALWLAAAMIVWGSGRILDRLRREGRTDGPTAAGGQRGWWLLAVMLTLGGVASPDTFGAEHGNYLPQRIVLFGLVALAVVVDIDLRRWSGRIATVGLAAAVALQSAIVWDYAVYSDRSAGEILRVRDAVGRGHRLAFLPASVRSRFRANPLMHVDNWLGVGTDNVVWGNYETRHYYFPVQFRPGLDRPMPDELEDIVLLDAPADSARRARDWEQLLAHHADAIDVLVTYKSDPLLDGVTERYFREVERRGDVRILRRDRAPHLARQTDGLDTRDR